MIIGMTVAHSASYDDMQDVRRSEAMRMLLDASGSRMDPYESDAAVIAIARSRGMIGAKNARPSERVTVAEFLKMFTKAFELPENRSSSFVDVPARSWYARYAGIAEQYRLFPYRTLYLAADTPMTRLEAATAIRQYIRGGPNNDRYRYAPEPRPFSDSYFDDRDRYSSRSTVTIRNFAFEPRVLSVRRGTTVRWVNDDNNPHTVTGDTTGPRSPLLDRDQSYSYTFSDLGTFPYHCELHPEMRGMVEVMP